MSKTNLELVQDLYAAFGRGDMQALMDALHPDVTWGMIGRPQDVPMAGIRNGKVGVGEFFKILHEVQQLRDFAPQKFVATDDTVCVIGHTKWTMNNNGVSGENDWVHVLTLKDGKIIKYRGHQDTGLLAEAYHAKPPAKRPRTDSLATRSAARQSSCRAAFPSCSTWLRHGRSPKGEVWCGQPDSKRRLLFC